MFSSKIFKVPGLTFKYLIDFELFLCLLLGNVLLSLFSHVAVQLSEHHLLKRLSFLHCVFSPLCHRLGDHRCVGLSLGFLSCSIDLYFYLSDSTRLS